MSWSRCWPVVLIGLVVAGTVGPVQAQQSIHEAREEPLGTTVTVEGTVTRAYGAYVRIQDESGPTGASAIVIRQTGGPNSGDFQDDIATGEIRPGTTLKVTGTTSAFYGLIQINNDDLDTYTVQRQGNPPAPQSVTLAELNRNGEDYESELLRVEGLRFASATGAFENETAYTVKNGEGQTREFRVQDTTETAIGGTPIPGGVFAFEGVLGQFHGGNSGAKEPDEGYQFIPIRTSDLQPALSFSFNRLFTQAEEDEASVSVQVRVFSKETDGAVSVTAQVRAASTAENGTDVTGFASPQTLTFTGTDPAPKTLTFDPADDGEQEGVERLEVSLSSDDGAVASPGTFTLWLLDNPTAQAPIAAGDSGEALIESLRQRYENPPTIGYDRARDSLYRRVYNEQSTVEAIYSGYQVTVDPKGGDASDQALDQGVNTEHIWPRSEGAEREPALSNMHILAPARDVVNSARSNYAFGEIPDADTDTWFFEDESQPNAPPQGERAAWSELDDSPADRATRRFEPRHSVKGDVARAAFYFAMAYPNRADLSFFEAQRETLLEWHRQDPVDATELRRSLIQGSYQGNEPNPFVLDSTLAPRAYGMGVPGPSVVSIQAAREQGAGVTVTVEGIVTRVGTEGVYLQDDTGGLYVFETSGSFGQNLGGTIRKGTRLQVTGTLEFYNGLLELTEVPEGGYEVVSQENALPKAVALTLGEIAQNGEAYESELVRVENVGIQADGDEVFRAGGKQGNYAIQDETGTLTLRVPEGSGLAGESIPARATFQGPLGQFNGGGPGADQPDSGYRLVAVEAGDLRSILPAETTVDVTRSFGAPGDETSYRLVALPGQVDRPLASTLDGEAGVAWQAYWDDGSQQDFFVRFDGSDRFAFRPGRGFWLLSTTDWSVDATFNTVDVSGGATSIPLHDGWNIVSNPLPTNVDWAEVEAANGGGLQALWRWTDSGFQTDSTFVSATSGEAFYFLNDQGLDQLSIPLPSPGQSMTTTAKPPALARAVTLRAQRPSQGRATVRVGEHEEARDGRGPRDLVAPPARFAPLSLRVRAEDAGARSARRRWLARDVRPAGSDGQTYRLVLRADTTGPVTLRAEDLPRSGAVVLLDSLGARYDLRRQSAVTLQAGPDPLELRLLVGTSSYVATNAGEQFPDRLTVHPPRPNPFREQTVLHYSLPAAQKVRVAVYDLLGRQVQTLVNARQTAGAHRVTWDGTGRGGRQLASGVYFIRWTTASTRHTEKVTVVR